MKFDPSKFAGGDADSGVVKLVTAVGRAWFSSTGLEWDSEQDCYERGLFTVREYLRHGYNGNLQTDTGLTLGEIARLFEQSETYPRLKREAAHYKDEADGIWKRIYEAKNKIRDTSVDYKRRQSAALLHLGIRNSKRRGGYCEKLIGTYYRLRLGGSISFTAAEMERLKRSLLRVDSSRVDGVSINHLDPDNPLIRVKPHTHHEAVQVIGNLYTKDSEGSEGWEAFEKQCRRDGISDQLKEAMAADYDRMREE
jgi:hypothetical protein